MTDFLARLAARITASDSGLRPNAPARFEPVPGLAGEAGLFEVDAERDVRASRQRWSEPSAPDPASTRFAPPPSATPVSSPAERAPAADTSGPAGVSPPVPGTLAAAQTGLTRFRPGLAPATEPPLQHFQTRLPAPPAGPASPPQPAPLQPAEANHTVEHHYHHERVMERVVTAEGSQPAPETQPVVPQAIRAADEADGTVRRQGAPTQTPELQIRQARQAVPQHPAPPIREPARPVREPSPEPLQAAPVVVRIDRLEVRVAPPRAAPAPSRSAQPTATPDLDRFLANLEGRRS